MYGSQGYNVINATNGVRLPLLRHRHDSRQQALHLGGQHDRSAGPRDSSLGNEPDRGGLVFEHDTSFTVDVDLTDGQSHNIELYLLDYDTTSRSEQIVLSDANTHAVLSTETVSNFHTGVYLSWTISGERADHDHEDGR